MPVTRPAPKHFAAESENPAPCPKVYKRPTRFPFAGQAFEETERHRRRCMLPVPKAAEAGMRIWGAALVACPSLGGPAKFVNELSGIIRRRARNLELLPLPPRS